MSSPASSASLPAPESGGASGETAKARVVQAARRHFFTHGFRNVTMDDLSEELGMSKKTLYTHFSGKNALLEEVIADKGRAVEADLDRISVECAGNFQGCLQQMLASMQTHTGEFCPAFIRDIRKEAPELFALVEKRRRVLFERFFGRLFQEGRRTGFIRKDIPVKVILEILLAATEAVVNPRKLDELGLTLKTGYPAVISVILEGVGTPRHRTKSKSHQK